MFDTFRDKTVVVTGAARGIGLGIARAFVDAGARVVMTDVLIEIGERAADDINAAGGRAQFVPHDVRDDMAWAGVMKLTTERWGAPDFLINNAGIETASLMTDLNVEELRRIFDINVFGVMLGVKHGFRSMRSNGSTGRDRAIVNIASTAAAMPGAGLSVYGASKAAVVHFSKSAALEAGSLGHHIRVNCILPGMTETTMASQLGDHFTALGLVPSATVMREMVCERIPLKRYAAVTEIAAVTMFLCSDAASYVNGVCLPVDGAYSVIRG